ncbi:MAG: glycosyltransferase [Acidobacteriaceae bacterium]|nr:glycosyltransferase [Acidobacteriaceae bacterium]
MLTTVHDAIDVRIFHREAKTLKEAGFRVSIIAPHPVTERRDGILIDALPHPANRLKRLLLSRVVIERARCHPGALFIFHDPELLGVGIVLRILGERVVYDCHENLPMQIFQKPWLPFILKWCLAPAAWLVEHVCSRLLTGVIVVGETYAGRFPRKRTVVVRNFALLGSIPDDGDVKPIGERRAVVIYAGGLSHIRGIAELVEAFIGLESVGAELWLVGAFDCEKFRLRILSSLPQNVKWLGRRTYSEVLRLYKQAKIGAVLHCSAPNHRHAIPIKILEYLAAGLPVVASNLPQFSDIVRDCGLQVDPHNVEEIRKAIRTLLSEDCRIAEMSKIARDRAAKCYSWNTEGQKLVDFCCRVLSA